MQWPAPFHPSFRFAWFPSSRAHQKPSEVQLLYCNSKFQEEILIVTVLVRCQPLSNQKWWRRDWAMDHKHGYKYEYGDPQGCIYPRGSQKCWHRAVPQHYILYLMSSSQVKFMQNIPFQPPWFLSWIIIIVKAEMRLMSKYRNKQKNWRAVWRFSLKGNHFLT